MNVQFVDSRRAERWSPVVAVGTLLVSVVLLTLSGVVALRGSNPSSVTAFVPMQLTFAATGALIVAKRPDNPVGWLFAAFGLLGSIAMLAIALSGGISLSAHDHPGEIVASPGGGEVVQQWAAWVATIWTELSLLPILLALLVFPTGRFLTRRWAWVAASVVAVELVGIVTTAVSDVNFHNNYAIADPVQLVSGDVMAPVYAAYQAAELAVIVTVAVGMVVRYRRSDAIARAQLTWVTFACSLLVVAIAVLLVLSIEPVWGFIVCLPMVPVAVAVAILRYRLFDIDRIVSRTVAYAIVTGLVLVTYVVIVSVASRLAPDTSTLAIAAATLLSAAIARPALSKAQSVVDRRFNRPRFNSKTTVDDFGGALRNHVDLVEVEALLLAAVTNTLQPSAARLELVEAQ